MGEARTEEWERPLGRGRKVGKVRLTPGLLSLDADESVLSAMSCLGSAFQLSLTSGLEPLFHQRLNFLTFSTGYLGALFKIFYVKLLE